MSTASRPQSPAKENDPRPAPHTWLETLRRIAYNADQQLADHDPYTREHCTRVAKWSLLIANRLPTFDRERLNRLEITALVHDYGKLDVPYRILNKPDKLTNDEFDQIKKHPEHGVTRVEILTPFLFIEGVRYHHVRYDGGGYPRVSFRAQEIPLEARIIAVADTFDAITSDRAYRKGKSPKEAIAIIREVAGGQLDPILATIFARYYEEKESGKGGEIGATTMFLSATLEEEVRMAHQFLEKQVGQFNPKDPLAKVGNQEQFVRDAIQHLIGLDVDEKTAEIFVRSAYALPIPESFERSEIDLTEPAMAALLKDTRLGRYGHIECTLPLKAGCAKKLSSMKVIVFNQMVWDFLADGDKVVLMR